LRKAGMDAMAVELGRMARWKIESTRRTRDQSLRERWKPSDASRLNSIHPARRELGRMAGSRTAVPDADVAEVANDRKVVDAFESALPRPRRSSNDGAGGQRVADRVRGTSSQHGSR
jgi:hypothetical protein